MTENEQAKMPAEDHPVAADMRTNRSKDQSSKDDGASEPSGSLLDTVRDPDVDTDAAEQIEERGEPFEGNHA